MRIKIYFRSEQRDDILQKLLVLHLQFNILHEFLVRRSPIRHKLNVLAITLQHLLHVQFACRQSRIKVKQVATLLALIECTHLCAHQFFKMIGGQLRFTRKPTVFHPKWHLLQPQHIEVLKAVDLHLQANLLNRRNLRIHPEQQLVAMPLLLRAAIRQPLQHLSQAKHDRLDRPGLDLHQVNVLTISRLWLQEQLVQSRTATECKILSQKVVTEYAHQSTTDDQVLLHADLQPSRVTHNTSCQETASVHQYSTKAEPHLSTYTELGR